MSAKKTGAALDDIGARIRKLRREKGITQAALAGKDLTRNMLSRIENGAALPSLPSLALIATRLDVPMGALLDDLDSFLAYNAQKQVRAMIREKKYGKALEICEGFAESSDFEALRPLYTEASVCRVRELYLSGELTAARELIEKVSGLCNNCDELYVLSELIAACKAVEAVNADSTAERLREVIFDKNDTAIYLWAIKKIGDIAARPYSQPSEMAAPLLSELSPVVNTLRDGFYKSHIEAKFEMLRAEYLSAKAKLLPLLSSDTPPALLWTVYTDLEFCCKCCGDFENAYNYSVLRLELIKKIN